MEIWEGDDRVKCRRKDEVDAIALSRKIDSPDRQIILLHSNQPRRCFGVHVVVVRLHARREFVGQPPDGLCLQHLDIILEPETKERCDHLEHYGLERDSGVSARQLFRRHWPTRMDVKW